MGCGGLLVGSTSSQAIGGYPESLGLSARALRTLRPFRSHACRRKQACTAVASLKNRLTRRDSDASTSSQGPLQELQEAVSRPIAAAEELSSSLIHDLDIATAGTSRMEERQRKKARYQLTYKIAAISASLGVTALAVLAVHYRFAWHMQNGGEIPYAEAICTVLLTFGGVVGMEMWARWAHRALWHDLPGGWALHKSHHEPRIGPFEANDVFAVVNAVPAIGLCAYGFLTPTLIGGVCFGTGLGITLFGIMYMFVHDGLVHKRFPVGPIAEVPYLKRVAAAHKLHHAERFNGVPWGLFLGPAELEAVGGKKDLDYMCQEMDRKKALKS